MHGNDYRLIASHELRNVLRNVCNDPRELPGRRELRAQFVAALPDADSDVIDALMTKAEAFAREAVDPGARFDLRARADELTLHVLKTYEAADRLVTVEEAEPVDIDAAVTAVEDFDPTQKGLRAVVDAHKAAELEAQRIRQIAGQS